MNCWCPLERNLGGQQAWFGRFGEQKPSGIEPRIVHPSVYSLYRLAILMMMMIAVAGRFKAPATSSVGIAISYGTDGPRIESRWGVKFSELVQNGLRAQPASCRMGTGALSSGKVAGAWR
jgi:hypothetical protein